MTVRKVPKNQVPAALHDNQDAVTVSQDGDIVTVRQTGELVSGYDGDAVLGTGMSARQLVALDLNVGAPPEGDAYYCESEPVGSIVGSGTYQPEATQELYGVGEGHIVMALDASVMQDATSATLTINTYTHGSKTLTINFVPNE